MIHRQGDKVNLDNVPNREYNISYIGKALETMRRKAKGPVKWQPVDNKNEQDATGYHISSGFFIEKYEN